MIDRKSVIDFAEARINEEVEQNKAGADNEPIIRYWRAYLDGAKAQMKEDKKPSPNEANEILLSAMSAYIRETDAVLNDLNEEIQNLKTIKQKLGGK